MTYGRRMATVTARAVPKGSLLAEFGGPEDYRDCFIRDVPGEVSLAEFIERFYCSLAFLPERLVLRLITGRSSSEDASAVARGEADRFGAWKLVERSGDQALLESKGTNTASWFMVESIGEGTRLYFGSWVGNLDQSGWKSMLRPHVW